MVNSLLSRTRTRTVLPPTRKEKVEVKQMARLSPEGKKQEMANSLIFLTPTPTPTPTSFARQG